MWNAQVWVGGPGWEDLSGNNCVSCWWPQPPPCDPCSSSQISSWYWACQLLTRASPGPGILRGWVEVRHLILRSFCCNSISASNFHALLPSYLPPSGLCWGKGDLRTPCNASESPLEVSWADTTPRHTQLEEEHWPWEGGTAVPTKGASPGHPEAWGWILVPPPRLSRYGIQSRTGSPSIQVNKCPSACLW